MTSKQQNALARCLFEAIDDVNFSNIVKLLEKHNANPNTIIPKLNIAPIHYAVGFEDVEFAEKVTALFLKKKADPNLSGEVDRLTPLHIASIWGRPRIVKMLLEHGGDLELKSAENETPISIAIRENNFEVIEVIQKFVFEQKIDRKKKDLILRASNQTAPEDFPTTPVKNNHLKKALQSIDEKSFTPNRINYNFDVTSPYYVNITHRRHKTSRDNSKLFEDDEDEQKNLFELTERNLSEFSKQMSQVIVIDRFAIHKRQSYIRSWREQIEQIKKSDGIDTSYINYLNMCNDVTLMEAAKGPATIEGGYRSDNLSEVIEIKSSNDSFVTAQSDLDRRGNAIQPKILEHVQENYIHSDTENGVVFFEKKIISKSRVNLKELEDNDLNEDKKNDLDNTHSSVSTKVTLPPLDYDTDVLRSELKELTGITPVITKNTKKLYLKQLVKKRLDTGSPEQKQRKTYPQELQRTIDKFNFLEENLEEFHKLESQMAKHFVDRPHIKWREGNLKTSFIYLLIDPRITNNLSLRYKEMTKDEVWSQFVSSIFYVGKGKQSRPYSHLYDAIKLFAQENPQLANRLENMKNQVIERKVIYSNAATAKNPIQNAKKNVPEKLNPNRAQESQKLKKIVDIWKSQSGVVCLHIFNNIMPVDAFTREAAIIEAIGLGNLTNLKNGDYYGCARNFSRRQKSRLGIGLLHRAMNIYLAEGESQLMPFDLI